MIVVGNMNHLLKTHLTFGYTYYVGFLMLHKTYHCYKIVHCDTGVTRTVLGGGRTSSKKMTTCQHGLLDS